MAYGGHLYLVCGVCDATIDVIGYSCFQAKFVDIIGIFFYTHSPYFCKNQAL